jgi:hypothetical protein
MDESKWGKLCSMLHSHLNGEEMLRSYLVSMEMTLVHDVYILGSQQKVCVTGLQPCKPQSVASLKLLHCVGRIPVISVG